MSAAADPLLEYRRHFPSVERTLHFASHTLGAMPAGVAVQLEPVRESTSSAPPGAPPDTLTRDTSSVRAAITRSSRSPSGGTLSASAKLREKHTTVPVPSRVAVTSASCPGHGSPSRSTTGSMAPRRISTLVVGGSSP